MSQKIVFIGGGNMATAIISGLVSNSATAPCIEVIDPSLAVVRHLNDRFGINVAPLPSDAIKDADIVLWAVKPQTIVDCIAQVKPFLGNSLHISIVTGVMLHKLAYLLGVDRIIRTMPNTPALIGRGVTALYANEKICVADRTMAERFMSSVGECMWLTDEAQMDAITALSGSGPAYVFYFMEQMIATGVQLGLDMEVARHLAVSTFLGASELAKQSGEEPGALRSRVTSKGGTTFAAISALDDQDVGTKFRQAIMAAKLRSEELSKSADN